MKLFYHVGLLSSALAVLQHAVSAWDIASSDAVATTNPINEHETLAKTWTISGDNALKALSSFSFGRVFIEYDGALASTEQGAPRIAAKVVFSGDNPDLLNAFEVVNDKDNENGVKIRLRNADVDTQGYLLTRVYVSDKQVLDTVSQAFSSDLIIGDDVVVQNDPTGNVTLALVGSGNIFYGSSSVDVSLAQFNVALVGSGDIQVLAKSLAVSSLLNLVVAGSGDVAVMADSVTVSDSLVVTIAGSGDAFVQSEHISTFNLSTAVAGSGSATFSRSGVCQEQDISIVGSGDVAAGSIQCVNTHVNLAGSGDVVVQTTGNLTVTSLFGSGDVRYYGTKPAVIDVTSGLEFFGHGRKQKVKQAKKNRYEEYEAEPTPQVELRHILVKASKSTKENDEPEIHEVIELDPGSGPFSFHAQNVQQTTQTMAAEVVHETHFVGIFMVVGVAFAAVGAAAVHYKHRAERAPYQPLV